MSTLPARAALSIFSWNVLGIKRGFLDEFLNTLSSEVSWGVLILQEFRASRSPALDFVTDGAHPELIKANRAIQLLYGVTDVHANRLLGDIMKQPLLNGCKPPERGTDNTKLLDTRSFMRLIQRLPNGTRAEGL